MAHKRFYVTAEGARVLHQPAGRYSTRMLTAGDPMVIDAPKARLWTRMGWATDKRPGRVRQPHDHGAAAHPAPKAAIVDDVAALRDAYQARFGKRPFNGWDAATLRQKIAAE